MADVFNTSYRTKADVNTEEERLRRVEKDLSSKWCL
jgi:hypothetical protein